MGKKAKIQKNEMMGFQFLHPLTDRDERVVFSTVMEYSTSLCCSVACTQIWWFECIAEMREDMISQ